MPLPPTILRHKFSFCPPPHRSLWYFFSVKGLHYFGSRPSRKSGRSFSFFQFNSFQVDMSVLPTTLRFDFFRPRIFLFCIIICTQLWRDLSSHPAEFPPTMASLCASRPFYPERYCPFPAPPRTSTILPTLFLCQLTRCARFRAPTPGRVIPTNPLQM